MSKREIIKDMSNMDYHAESKHYSSSVLKKVLKGLPAFLEYINRDKKDQDRRDLQIGNYLHMAILEPELSHTVYIAPEDMKGRNSAKYRNWKAATVHIKDPIVLLHKEKKECDILLENFKNTVVDMDLGKIDMPKLFNSPVGQAEVSFFDTLNDVEVKVRPDYYELYEDRGIIRDLKSTRFDVDDEDEAKFVTLNSGYHISAALYVMVMEQIFQRPFTFEWVYISKDTKTTSLYRCSDETLLLGKCEVIKALEMIKKWKKNDFKKAKQPTNPKHI